MRKIIKIFTAAILLFPICLAAEDTHDKEAAPDHREAEKDSAKEDHAVKEDAEADAEEHSEESTEGEGESEDHEVKKPKKKRWPVNLLTDPRGKPDLTVCSQNLHNYGVKKQSMVKLGITEEQFLEKQRALAERIVKAKCDVVAAQEIVAKSEEEGREALNQLAKEAAQLGGRFYDVKAGSSNETSIRNGFLVAKDRAEIINVLSYSKVELPKISEKQKPRFFLRSPVEIQLTVKSHEEGRPKTVTLITFHSKSKSGSAKDPAELQWETYRMEMSEAIRRIVEVRHRKSLISPDNLLIVLGDRNANFDMASAQILEGNVRLSDFKADSFCRLSKRGVPLCKPGAQSAPVLFSVLTSDLHTKLLPGTYTFKKVYSWIDDILLASETLPFAWANYEKPADYDSGVIYEPKKASDHALVYVRLNW